MNILAEFLTKPSNVHFILLRSIIIVTIKNKGEKARFLVVGGANTALDFGILFLLKSLGLPVISANIISTSVAFCFSYFANKKFTFKATDTNIKREIILFILVTLFGLWVLQTIIINISVPVFSHLGFNEAVSLFIAKLLATVVSLIWNYVLYSKLVFKQRDK